MSIARAVSLPNDPICRSVSTVSTLIKLISNKFPIPFLILSFRQRTHSNNWNSSFKGSSFTSVMDYGLFILEYKQNGLVYSRVSCAFSSIELQHRTVRIIHPKPFSFASSFKYWTFRLSNLRSKITVYAVVTIFSHRVLSVDHLKNKSRLWIHGDGWGALYIAQEGSLKGTTYHISRKGYLARQGFRLLLHSTVQPPSSSTKKTRSPPFGRQATETWTRTKEWRSNKGKWIAL